MSDEEEDRLVGVVWEGFAGPRSIPVKLRMGQGLDRVQLDSVKDALDALIERFESRTEVPKRLAAALLDIHQAMEQGASLYSQAERDEIEDAADELSTIAAALLCGTPVDEDD